MTVYKSARKPSDADSLSSAPLEQVCEDIEEDTAFVGAKSPFNMATRQRADAELRPVVDRFEGKNIN